uniref:Fibrinogen C-terminal domain-containing protein n=1 Tax=Amphimedon queenslandica TaxID=400682 RepID=A0A1X7TJB3_AMPQE
MNESVKKLIKITNTLSDHVNTSTSIATVVDDIQLVVKELLSLQQDSLPTSCEEVKQRQHNSPSGIYLIKSLNGTIHSMYCNMSYNIEGGWTRVAYLNMSNIMQSCPSVFRLYQSGGVRACGRPVTNDGSCASVQFPSNGIRYSQIRGRVLGYQYRSTDGLRALLMHHYSINSSYVDGVSITRGSSRQHVWTFASGSSDTDMESDDTCPCSSGSLSVQSFIGTHYFCESGNHEASGNAKQILYTSDPLWDGQSCGSNEGQCCLAPGIPWFHRDYGNNTTTDYIELRLCCSQGTDNEDITVHYYDIYIK